MTSIQLLFLGTGASVGVPIIGCQCAVCSSEDPRNRRLRSSVLLSVNGKRLLIDAGPDLRMQALCHEVTAIDGVLLTHAHYDHTAGIDDLRPFSFRRQSPLPVLLSQETADDLHQRFSYLFREEAKQRLQLEIMPYEEGEIIFAGVPIRYVTYIQANMQVNGFQIGHLAYLCDIKHFTPAIFQQLKGVEVLVISALRYTHSALHLSVDEAIDFSREIGAKEVWLTHLSHDLDYVQLNAYLPSHIRAAYDGLKITSN